MSNPYARFFWNDYGNDLGLRTCSLAAQGLWMRMLTVMALADRPGYLAVKGEPITAPELARLIGKDQDEVEPLFAELERRGVFSRDRKGRVFSRRIVRDENLRQKCRENGKRGGNPALLATNGKDTGNSSQVNPQDNGRVKGGVKPRARVPFPLPKNPPYSPPASGGPANPEGLGRLTLSSGAYIDRDGVYRMTPEQRRRALAQMEEAPKDPPEESEP
jgi:hypothetical protein